MNNSVSCKICGQTMKDLTSHIFRKHNIKAARYKELYPNMPIRSDALLKLQSERIKGNKNPAHNHGGKFSPFSEKYIHGTKNVEAIKQKAKENKQKLNKDTTKLSYWLEKTNGNVEEAEKLLAQRQATFSLDKCIAKYGNEKGHEIWLSRQEKWQKKINDKSIEEKQRINRLKVGNGYSVSKAEKEILDILVKNNFELDHQFSLVDNTSTKQYIYDFQYKNKIIEYNGDWWHCNPNKYSEDYYHPRIHLTAKEIWNKDKNKQNYAISKNYEVLVIWESDYKNDKNGTIEKCLIFLKQ